MTMGTQLRHAAPPSASWGTDRPPKRMEVAVSPVLVEVKRLPAEVEPADCLTPAARLILAASLGVGGHIRRNTPSSSPSWVSCANRGSDARRCLAKVQCLGVFE